MANTIYELFVNWKRAISIIFLCSWELLCPHLVINLCISISAASITAIVDGNHCDAYVTSNVVVYNKPEIRERGELSEFYFTLYIYNRCAITMPINHDDARAVTMSKDNNGTCAVTISIDHNSACAITMSIDHNSAYSITMPIDNNDTCPLTPSTYHNDACAINHVHRSEWHMWLNHVYRLKLRMCFNHIHRS